MDNLAAFFKIILQYGPVKWGGGIVMLAELGLATQRHTNSTIEAVTGISVEAWMVALLGVLALIVYFVWAVESSKPAGKN